MSLTFQVSCGKGYKGTLSTVLGFPGGRVIAPFWYRIYLFAYLFIFNLFIIEKFISITTRIAFHKQQDLSQIRGVVNKIAKCWYRWYQTFETKSPFVVLVKVNPKQEKKGEKKHPMQPSDNWHYIIMNW